MYYVYELINLMGTVEYVGQSKRPYVRFAEHTRVKPKYGSGKGYFYHRNDIFLNIVASYETEAEARQEEFELQKYWGFTTDRDKCKHANHARGSKNGSAKLNEQQVREIKELIENGESLSSIGRKYGVGQPCISLIKKNKNWSHIK